jgi:hypothetical protein
MNTASADEQISDTECHICRSLAGLPARTSNTKRDPFLSETRPDRRFRTAHGQLNSDDDHAQMDQTCAFELRVGHGCVSIPEPAGHYSL